MHIFTLTIVHVTFGVFMNQYKTKFPERLFACWHPVGYSHEIKAEEPFGTILLDEAIVIWRTSDGCAHAMRDLCIHRGTALSLGWIEKDCIVCPYHAWQYDKENWQQSRPPA